LCSCGHRQGPCRKRLALEHPCVPAPVPQWERAVEGGPPSKSRFPSFCQRFPAYLPTRPAGDGPWLGVLQRCCSGPLTMRALSRRWSSPELPTGQGQWPPERASLTKAANHSLPGVGGGPHCFPAVSSSCPALLSCDSAEEAEDPVTQGVEGDTDHVGHLPGRVPAGVPRWTSVGQHSRMWEHRCHCSTREVCHNPQTSGTRGARGKPK
jgi:hypothetical protein